MTLYEFRDELATLGTAFLNTPEETSEPPYMVAFLVTSALVTFEGGRSFDLRIDCVGRTFPDAQALADAVRLHNWPWSVSFQSEKDDYQTPTDGAEVIHVVSVNLRVLA